LAKRLQEGAEHLRIHSRKTALAAGRLVMAGGRVLNREEIVEDIPDVGLRAMPRLPLADVEHGDLCPSIVARRQRWLSREGQPIAPLEVKATDDRCQRTA
jgi:hypothetical protein